MDEPCSKALGRVDSKSFQKHSCIECIDPAELPPLAVGEVSQLDVNLTKVTTVSPAAKLWKMHKINSEFRDWTDLSTSQG